MTVRPQGQPQGLSCAGRSIPPDPTAAVPS
jgi:hypothetical protein